MKASYLLVLGLAVVAAGCGSTAPTSTSVPPTSTPAASGSPTSTPAAPGSTPAAVYYAGAAASVDAAYVAWTSAIAGSPEPSQLVAPAAMYAAPHHLRQRLVDIGATGSTASDIATLVSDDQTVIKDLNQISNVANSDLPDLGGAAQRRRRQGHHRG